MKRGMIILGIVIALAVISVFYFSLDKTFVLERHTCLFDKETLDIECSEELRILIKEKRQISCTYPCIDPPGATGYDCKEIDFDDKYCEYEAAVYSETNKINLKDIKPQAVNLKDNLEDPQFDMALYYRVVEVKNIETEETFGFYIKDSETYDVEGDFLLEYTLELCKFEENGNLCMPEQHWRCEQGAGYEDGCYAIIGRIQREELPIDFCYELEYENLVSYCLGQTNIDECSSYAEKHPKTKRMCATIKCQEESKVEYEPGKFTIVDRCVDTYAYGTSLEECDLHYSYDEVKGICEENPYYPKEECLANFEDTRQRCIDYHTE